MQEQKKLKMTILDPTDVICCQKILEANELIKKGLLDQAYDII